jgi:hypothetical protein
MVKNERTSAVPRAKTQIPRITTQPAEGRLENLLIKTFDSTEASIDKRILTIIPAEAKGKNNVGAGQTNLNAVITDDVKTVIQKNLLLLLRKVAPQKHSPIVKNDKANTAISIGNACLPYLSGI